MVCFFLKLKVHIMITIVQVQLVDHLYDANMAQQLPLTTAMIQPPRRLLIGEVHKDWAAEAQDQESPPSVTFSGASHIGPEMLAVQQQLRLRIQVSRGQMYWASRGEAGNIVCQVVFLLNMLRGGTCKGGC